MEHVWVHTFARELRVSPCDEAKGVVLTEVPLNPKQNREKMTEIMFELFGVPNLFVANQAVMSLYAYGRTTGLVVDSGYDFTHTVPVIENSTISSASNKMEIAGNLLTHYLQKLLSKIDYSFTSLSELEINRDIKEQMCYVALNYDDEKAANKLSNKSDIHYTLPDDKVATVTGYVRMTAPELLFKPEFHNRTCDGLH